MRSTVIEGQPEIELLKVQYPVFTRVSRGAGRELVQHHHETEASKVIEPALAGLKRAGLLERAKQRWASPVHTVQLGIRPIKHTCGR